MGLFAKKFTLVYVCKANITRSAYLKGYTRHCLRTHRSHARRKLRVLSAGIQARHGGSASQVVQHVARLNGFSLAGHRSSPLSRKLVKKADAILVMERGQKDVILKFLPEARDKTYLLTEYRLADEESRAHDIPDPTGLDTTEYRTFIDAAHAEVERILRELERDGII
jgi:protein-tyrosine phosphatase